MDRFTGSKGLERRSPSGDGLHLLPVYPNWKRERAQNAYSVSSSLTTGTRLRDEVVSYLTFNQATRVRVLPGAQSGRDVQRPACEASNLVVWVRVPSSALLGVDPMARYSALTRAIWVRVPDPEPFRLRLTVGPTTLDRGIGVRVPEPELPPCPNWKRVSAKDRGVESSSLSGGTTPEWWKGIHGWPKPSCFGVRVQISPRAR